MSERAFKRRPASPWKVYPEWPATFLLRPTRSLVDDRVSFSAPICVDCGAIAPADGLHCCLRCRGGR